MSEMGVMIALVALWALTEEATAATRPVCPPETGVRCRAGGGGLNEYFYIVEGRSLILEFVDGAYFYLKCIDNLSLENNALPRFETDLRVETVAFRGCAPPATSYAAALAALNVSVAAMRELRLLDLPAVPPLRASNLGGLSLMVLKMYGSRRIGALPPEPEPDFLAETPQLRSLIVDVARLPAATLEQLPVGLVSLLLTDAGVERVSKAALTRLSRLVELTVRSRHAVVVEGGAAASLRILSLDAPGAAAPAAARPPTLERLVLRRATESEPAPWAGCDELLELRILNAAARALPARWVAACPRLSSLTVSRAVGLVRLEPELLAGARALTHLELSHTALEELPAGLLDGAPGLQSINLSGNRLRTLPSGVFLWSRSLRTLNLSHNLFSADVVDSLQSLSSLRTLSLEGNARLGDLCSGGDIVINGLSPLRALRGLEELSLRGTGVASVCRDWREEMPRLRKLDLSNTNVTRLTYVDILYVRDDDVRDAAVDLTGANVTAVLYTAADYLAALQPGAARSRATVTVDSRPICDCRMYWTARAMRERPEHASLVGLRCDGAGLAHAPLDALTCAEPELCARLPAACRCAWREDGPPEAPVPLVTVDCERAGLDRPPSPLPGRSWRLLLANNSLRELRAGDLPRDLRGLRELDLRDNRLERVDGAVAAALVEFPGLSVRLAGNPLACDCTAEPLLVAVRARPGAFDPAARCGDGRALASLAPLRCASGALAATLGGALAAVAAAALALTGCLSRPDRRLWLKAVLHRWGWLPRAAEPDDGHRFDAFVSFSHHDASFVSELVARLEGGRPPYRLCLHDRDWAPGEWIPAQIAASVRASRRTLAVVSRHFLRSKWARAEFREAQAQALRSATPRLVVVLLEAPDALPLDRELRTYLARNTYVQWGDRWFWDKLLLAMPPPRAYNSPESDPHAPAPTMSDPHAPAAAACAPDVPCAAPATPSSLWKVTPSPQNISISTPTQTILPSPISMLTTPDSCLKMTISSSPLLTRTESSFPASTPTASSSPTSSRVTSSTPLKIELP